MKYESRAIGNNIGSPRPYIIVTNVTFRMPAYLK